MGRLLPGSPVDARCGVDRKELYAAICDDLNARSTWEDRQGLLYKARYRGLRRKNIPFPGASDINWPLVDGIISKLAPVYFGQMFATDLIATFLPTAEASGNAAALAQSASQWFDYQVKQESNLEVAILNVIDYLLMLGRPAMKTTWDVDRGKLVFSPIQPSHLITPDATTDLCDADRIVHVQRYTVEAYRRMPGFRNDADFVKRITGDGTSDPASTGETSFRNEHIRRAGITQGAKNEIVLWEVWVQEERGKWFYETFSPLCPEESVKTRVANPNDHGEPPFVDFPHEITQPDWLAPRGVCEIVLAFQAQLTKLLNEKNDALTFAGRPMFQAERDVPNTGNIRFSPGQILPFGVKPAVMPAPPVDWERQMMLMRDVAERLVSVPDFGMSQTLEPRKSRTLGELEMMQGQTQQSGDLRMRNFRRSLGRLFQQAWSLLRQYASNRLTIWLNDSLVTVPKEALSGTYRLRPSGSADGVTRQQVWRKAVARFQMFANDPFVNQSELRKSVLEADETGLVKRLFVDPGVEQAGQAEEQMMEVGVIKLGFPAVISAKDDHATHIRTIIRYVQTQVASGQSPTPAETQLLAQHVAEHVEALRQVDPKMAKAAADAFAMLGEQVQAVQSQQARQAPANVPLSIGGAA